MKILPIASSLLFVGSLFAFSQLNPTSAEPTVAPAPASVEAHRFKVDSGHSSVLFRIKHMKVSYFYGRFNQVEGSILLDEASPEKSSVEITIKAASVDSNSKKRDEHILSPDFLDAKQFPELTFKSTSVKKDGGTWKVTGDLGLHGTKQEITFDFEKVGEAKGRSGGAVAGFHTVFTIAREDWGMDYMMGPLGSEIEMTISLEAKRP